MPDLHVALEEGFDADHVVVQVDQTIVFDEPAVSTRHQIGLAAAVDVPASPATPSPAADPAHQPAQEPARLLRIALPERGLATELPVNPAAAPFVRVSVVEGALQVSASADMPFYA